MERLITRLKRNRMEMDLERIVGLALSILVVLMVLAGSYIALHTTSTHQAISPTAINSESQQFVLKSCKVIDLNGYASIELHFESSIYPIDLTISLSGEILDFKIIEGDAGPVLLKLVKQPFTNVKGKYVLKVGSPHGAVFTTTIEVDGPVPIIEDVKSHPSTLPNVVNLKLSIRNVGDAPLYVTPSTLKIYIDGYEVPVHTDIHVIEPGTSKLVDVELLLGQPTAGIHTVTIILVNRTYTQQLPI